MGVSKNRGTPKSWILIGFSIIFTIHFVVPLFLETPIFSNHLDFSQFLLSHFPPGLSSHSDRLPGPEVEKHHMFGGIATLPETHIFGPENRPGPKGMDRLPTIEFQWLLLLVSGSVSMSPIWLAMKSLESPLRFPLLLYDLIFSGFCRDS